MVVSSILDIFEGYAKVNIHFLPRLFRFVLRPRPYLGLGPAGGSGVGAANPLSRHDGRPGPWGGGGGGGGAGAGPGAGGGAATTGRAARAALATLAGSAGAAARAAAVLACTAAASN